MAARFPQSGSSVAYQIKAAYSAKILAIYWAASADSVHRLYPGDSASTIITRSTSGAGFNATDGRITGSVTGAAGVYFSDSKSGGFGVAANGAFGYGASYYGDAFNGTTGFWAIGDGTPMDPFDNASKIKVEFSGANANVSGSPGYGSAFGVLADDAQSYFDLAFRHDQTDGTAKQRVWVNGSEWTAGRINPTTPSDTANIGDTGNPLIFGGSFSGAGNTAMEFECCYVHTGLSDAELDAITADPSIIIEAVSASTPIAFTGTIPTQTFTDGDSVSVDLSGYFSGTETPFSYSSVGASFAALGLTINSSTGFLEGTAATGSVSGCQIRGTDTTPDTADSNTFTITVNAAADDPVITVQPTADTVKAGQTAEFTITATGSGTVTYQWQEDNGGGFTNISDGGAYSGATTDTLNIVTTRAMNGYDYRCNVSDDDAGPVTSDEVALTVQQCVLALNAAPYDFGTGSDRATMAALNGGTIDLWVYPLAQKPPSSPIASYTGATNSSGLLPDLGDDDLLFGVTYRVLSIVDATDEGVTWNMVAS